MLILEANSLSDIMQLGVAPTGHDMCYRGQSNASWSLIPSVFRPLADQLTDLKAVELNWIGQCERDSYREFELRGRPLYDLNDKWEILCLAQHHGAPTRLLDWTKNLLVAVFFAVYSEDDTDAAVWCLDLSVLPFPPSLGRRHPGGGHRLEAVREYCKYNSPSFFLPISSNSTASDTATSPSSAFLLIDPPTIDARIGQQEALLSLHLSFHDHDLEWDYTHHLADIESRHQIAIVTKIVIPKTNKRAIRTQVETQTRITLYRLFPDLSGLSRWLSEENRVRFQHYLERSAGRNEHSIPGR